MYTAERTKRQPLLAEEVLVEKVLEPVGPDPGMPSSYHYPLTFPAWIAEKEKIMTRKGGSIRPALDEVVDFIIDDQTGAEQTWNPFQHFKSVCPVPAFAYALPFYVRRGFSIYRGVSRAVPFAYPQYHEIGNLWDPEPYGPFGQFDKDLPKWDDPTLTGGFVPPPANLEHLTSLSLRKMLPIVKAELSTLNTLIELKDIKRAASSARGLVTYLTNLRKQAKQLGKRGTLRELLRTASDAFLSYKFAILPLLSDIAGIHRAVSGLESRINDLVSRAGRKNRVHYTHRFAEYADVHDVDEVPEQDYLLHPYVFEDDELYGYSYSAFTSYRDVTYSDSVFHAELEYNYNYTEYQTEHARLLTLLDRFGVNFNPSIIWNAIPWSFVVDWLIDVGRYLDSFKVTLFEPRINIHRFLWSIKRERRILVGRRYRPFTILGVELPNGHGYHFPEVIQTAYRRECSLPSSSSISSSGLNSNEFLLGSALVLSRGRHRRNRGR